MALTIDAIHAPLNDFFLSRFKTDNGDAAQFRFDRVGPPVSPADFANYGLGLQTFSELVNYLPVDRGDGVTIDLSSTPFDDQYYYQIFSPSTACVPDGMDEPAAAAIMSAFGALRTEGDARWKKGFLASIRPTGGQYVASYATPADWYDMSMDGSWTSQTFDISEPQAAPASPSLPSRQLWRMRLAEAPAAPVFRHPVGAVDPLPPVALKPRPALATAAVLRTAGPAVAPAAALTAPDQYAAHNPFAQRVATLNLGQRMIVNRDLMSAAPTRPTDTNSISVSFDYCIVGIKRPWLFDAFLRDTSWCIPGMAKGALTAEPGRALSAITVACVAIRKLIITAHWTNDDIAHSMDATDFGPFKIDSAIVEGKLAHQGVQVIGWLIQALPVLPPNDAP